MSQIFRKETKFFVSYEPIFHSVYELFYFKRRTKSENVQNQLEQLCNARLRCMVHIGEFEMKVTLFN